MGQHSGPGLAAAVGVAAFAAAEGFAAVVVVAVVAAADSADWLAVVAATATAKRLAEHIFASPATSPGRPFPIAASHSP